MIKKKIAEQIYIALDNTIRNDQNFKPKTQGHEAVIVANFIDEFKKQLDALDILRVEVISKWIKIFYIWFYLESFLF